LLCLQILYGFALFYGGLAQFCAGMWELWRNNMFAAVAFSSYGAFWMGFAIYNILALVGCLQSHAMYCSFPLA
jgi:uncharacterized protein